MGGALVVALIATGVVFSIARGTTEVAALGTAGIYEEASLSAAAAARNRTVQALLIGKARALGFATEAELTRSIESVEAAGQELVQRTQRLTDELEDDALVGRVTANSASFTEAIDHVVGLLRAGDLTEAEAAIDSELDRSYQGLAALLADERDGAMARMALSREDAGRLADAARFLVALLLPLSLLLAYRARVRNQQKRRDLEQQLGRQRAVSTAKDEFIANLSHELRTPLTGIYGFALELIDHGPEFDAELSRELARLIAGESAELSRMVEDLLTAATAEQSGLVMSMTDVDPAAEVAAVLGPLAATGVEVDSRTERALISADRLRLRQIIRNLVSNAKRHGGPHTTIIGRSDGTKYVIEVRDDGPGVPPELEDDLFTRFIHRGKSPLVTGSVGLGLSIAQLLAEGMGGTIAYRREPEATVFSVTLPLSASVAATPTSPGSRSG